VLIAAKCVPQKKQARYRAGNEKQIPQLIENNGSQSRKWNT